MRRRSSNTDGIYAQSVLVQARSKESMLLPTLAVTVLIIAVSVLLVLCIYFVFKISILLHTSMLLRLSYQYSYCWRLLYIFRLHL